MKSIIKFLTLMGVSLTSLMVVNNASARIPPDTCFTLSGSTITNYSTDSNCPKDVVIPERIGGTNITSIGEAAFSGKELTSVIIPDTITTISNSGFYNNKITSVIIPDSVKDLGEAAFESNSLAYVKIGAGITELSDRVFMHNKLSSIVIPNNITTIGKWAFEDNNFETIDIPNSVTTIKGSAFGLNKLKHVTIPDSVTFLGERSFSHSKQLRSIKLPSGNLTTIGTGTFKDNQLTSVTIPANIKNINADAFISNKLRTIIFLRNNNDTTIGENAFNYQNDNGNISGLSSSGTINAYGVWKIIGNTWTKVSENPVFLPTPTNNTPFFASGSSNISNKFSYYNQSYEIPALEKKMILEETKLDNESELNNMLKNSNKGVVFKGSKVMILNRNKLKSSIISWLKSDTITDLISKNTGNNLEIGDFIVLIKK